MTDLTYDAFFSYTSGAATTLVRRTERFIEGFHRQWLLRKLRLKPLSVCVDGSDFKLRLGDSIESVEATLRHYVTQSRYLVVFCSAAAVKSEYVALEIRVFLESHSPGAILPVVTEGDDPSAAPERIFPKALIEHNCHKAVWLDFRGARISWWRRRSLRLRPFNEERVKLAAELHGKAPNILPTWKRAAAIRKRVATAAGVSVAALALVTARQTNRNRALTTAQAVKQEIDRGGGSSIQDLQLRAADAAGRFHVLETDIAFRRAAALTFKRHVATMTGPVAVSANTGRAIRIMPSGLELTDNAPAGPWRSIATGQFTHVDIADDGMVAAALDAGGVLVWRDGAAARCTGQPPEAIGRALAVDPAGGRVAALFQSGQTWSIAIGRVTGCPANALPVWAMSTLTSTATGDGLRSSPDRAEVRLKLSRGGGAVIASSEAGWLLAKVPEAGAVELEPLNGVLEEAWRNNLPEAAPGRATPIVITDEEFSGNGQFVAVAAARAGGLSRGLGPSTMLIPLLDAAEPIVIEASRTARTLAMAKTSPLLAVATDNRVRLWNLSVRRDVATFPVRGQVTALAFGSEDTLLLVSRRAEQPRLEVRDVRSGALLGSEPVSEVSAILTGGVAARMALARFARASDRSAIYDLRAPHVVARVEKAEEHIRTAALLNPAGVVFTGASMQLSIVRGKGQDVEHIPLKATAKQVTASRTAVFVLLDDGQVLRCELARSTCEVHKAADPHVTSLAVDRSDTLLFGCADGRVVSADRRCSDAEGAASGHSADAVLSLSDTAALKRVNGRACVSSRQESDACVPLSNGNERVVAGSLSADGSMAAVAIATAEGSGVDIYQRSLQWLPWPAWRYVRRSAIDDPGEVLALEFATDGAWISAATVWNSEIVVRCFPVKADAMAVANCPGD